MLLFGGWLVFFLLPLLRTMRKMPSMRITISATPPTAPPTIAPMGTEDFEEPVDEEVVAGADDVVLDPATDVVELPPFVLALELVLLLVLKLILEASNW